MKKKLVFIKNGAKRFLYVYVRSGESFSPILMIKSSGLAEKLFIISGYAPSGRSFHDFEEHSSFLELKGRKLDKLLEKVEYIVAIRGDFPNLQYRFGLIGTEIPSISKKTGKILWEYLRDMFNENPSPYPTIK